MGVKIQHVEIDEAAWNPVPQDERLDASAARRRKVRETRRASRRVSRTRARGRAFVAAGTTTTRAYRGDPGVSRELRETDATATTRRATGPRLSLARGGRAAAFSRHRSRARRYYAFRDQQGSALAKEQKPKNAKKVRFFIEADTLGSLPEIASMSIAERYALFHPKSPAEVAAEKASEEADTRRRNQTFEVRVLF